MRQTAPVGALEFRWFSEADRGSVIHLWEACDLVRPWNDPGKDIDRQRAVDDGHRGWINYLAVDPAERGARIGERVVAEAERRLRALGCAKVNLQIRRKNADVGAFYRCLGYVSEDVISMGKRPVDDAQ